MRAVNSQARSQRDSNPRCRGSRVQGDLSPPRRELPSAHTFAHARTLAFMNSADSHPSAKVINVLDCE